MAFYVGQRVQCVDASDGPQYTPRGYKALGGMDGLRQGAIYTVRSVGVWPNSPALLLWLSEIVRPLRGSMCVKYGEAGFDARRFRPITERKTSIEIFKAMLNPSKQEVST